MSIKPRTEDLCFYSVFSWKLSVLFNRYSTELCDAMRQFFGESTHEEFCMRIINGLEEAITFLKGSKSIYADENLHYYIEALYITRMLHENPELYSLEAVRRVNEEALHLSINKN